MFLVDTTKIANETAHAQKTTSSAMLVVGAEAWSAGAVVLIHNVKMKSLGSMNDRHLHLVLIK